MPSKRTTFPTKTKIGIHLKELFVITGFSDQKKPICLKMQICIERIVENANLMHFHRIVPNIRSSEGTREHSNHKL